MSEQRQPSKYLPTPPRTAVEKVHAVLIDFFHRYIPRGATPASVVAAVSGGPDSICLADALDTLRSESGIRLAIAHLNHGLRGKAADEDAEYVRQFAESRTIPCYIGIAHVDELAAQTRQSIEVSAREARYRFLASCCASIGATHVAVAHHADDQAETMLLRLLRGTGITGLRGMQPVTTLKSESLDVQSDVLLIRPLLTLSRHDIEEYCIERQLATRQDSTNEELTYMRNRIRKELLPLMETYNPGIRRVLVRLAETATSDVEIIEFATTQALSALMRNEPDQPITLDRLAWRRLPVGLQRAVLRESVRRAKGSTTDLKFAGIEEAREVLNSSAMHADIAILADMRIIVKPAQFSFIDVPSAGML